MPVLVTPQKTQPSKRGSAASIACQNRSESKITRSQSHTGRSTSSGNRTWLAALDDEVRFPRKARSMQNTVMSQSPPLLQPFYICQQDEPFFATLHDAHGPARDVAVVMCPPFGWEDMCSYRGRLEWASSLAAEG